MARVPSNASLLWRKQDWAYTNLRNWIVRGELRPDERIDQDSLAAELGVSRVPLRQALVRLSAEGLVEQQPHQHWSVCGVSLADARDVYAGRAALESLLTRVAATVITDVDIKELEDILVEQSAALQAGDLEIARARDRTFHNRICQCSGLARTWQAQKQLRAMSDRYIAIFMSDRNRAQTSMKEHYGILDALRRNDAESSASLAAAHVEGALGSLEKLLQDSTPR